MVTPFKNDRVMFHGLIANVEKMNETGLSGYFVLGTNGEYKSLSVDERFQVLRTVVKYRAKDKGVMAGTGFESTKETIDMVLRAADEGADMASLLMPHFFAKKMTPEVLAGYITDVADASPIPVVLYNNPSVAVGRHHQGRSDQTREGSSECDRHQGQLERYVQAEPRGGQREDVRSGRLRQLFSRSAEGGRNRRRAFARERLPRRLREALYALPGRKDGRRPRS